MCSRTRVPMYGVRAGDRRACLLGDGLTEDAIVGPVAASGPMGRFGQTSGRVLLLVDWGESAGRFGPVQVVVLRGRLDLPDQPSRSEPLVEAACSGSRCAQTGPADAGE